MQRAAQHGGANIQAAPRGFSAGLSEWHDQRRTCQHGSGEQRSPGGCPCQAIDLSEGHCASARATEAAITSCSRTAFASCLKPGKLTATSVATDGSLTIIDGLVRTPLTRYSKCRFGPVAVPVEPTVPMFWPCSTR